ncbi:(d)CMP kinase [Pseudoteredinibacter isoporae]|uniref:(d)CMP kinase n=1 Tax=Pseudoteredinibacter isoporae TaxID=570281 RepID=UPI003104C522
MVQQMAFIITIDGPSGAGKGTVSAKLAHELGFALLDSGALYRLTGLAARLNQCDFSDSTALGDVARSLDVEFRSTEAGVTIYLAGQDVSQAIRTEQAGMDASAVAAVPAVRDALLQRQRDFAQPPGVVADGRDMGSTVFPQAQLKVFLTASAEERARRRLAQLQLSNTGEHFDYDKILQDIEARDKQDSERSSSPLQAASDAVLLDSSEMSIAEVLEEVLSLYRSRR